MGMRDILVTLLVFGSLPLILWRPYLGILVWSWLSYMNPHRLCFGFAVDFPFAQIVAITMFLSVLLQSGKLSLPKDKVVVIWAIFIIWICASTYFALVPDRAFIQFVKIIKIQLIILFTMLLIDDRQKLNQLVWTIVLSISFFSVKGGIFTITTGGSFTVFGPPDSFIAENNALGLASLMVLPLMLYLYRISQDKKWIQRGLILAILLSTFSIVGSQSRGAFLAIIAVGIFFWLKSKTKLMSSLGVIVLAVLVFNFMPQSWHDRMSTITNYEQDASAMGRINAWNYSLNVANDRLTGAGLESWSYETFAVYAPNPRDVHAAHSIYFSALGDHGWVGLILFLTILFWTWRSTSFFIRENKNRRVDDDLVFLSKMLQVSFVAYLSGGAFLSLTYFDLPWHLVAIVVIIGTRLTAQNVEVGSMVQSKISEAAK